MPFPFRALLVRASSETTLHELQTHVRSRATYTEGLRYNERSGAERVNGRLKDDFGKRYVRVRGHAKVLCHLMFGILALTCDQLLRLIV